MTEEQITAQSTQVSALEAEKLSLQRALESAEDRLRQRGLELESAGGEAKVSAGRLARRCSGCDRPALNPAECTIVV